LNSYPKIGSEPNPAHFEVNHGVDRNTQDKQLTSKTSQLPPPAYPFNKSQCQRAKTSVAVSRESVAASGVARFIRSQPDGVKGFLANFWQVFLPPGFPRKTVRSTLPRQPGRLNLGCGFRRINPPPRPRHVDSAPRHEEPSRTYPRKTGTPPQPFINPLLNILLSYGFRLWGHALDSKCGIAPKQLDRETRPRHLVFSLLKIHRTWGRGST